MCGKWNVMRCDTDIRTISKTCAQALYDRELWLDIPFLHMAFSYRCIFFG